MRWEPGPPVLAMGGPVVSMPFFDPEKVVGVLDRLQPVAIRVAPERCLNRRHKDSKCSLCLACPTGAIVTTAMSVMVSAEKCVTCGLCVSVCPTEAFSVQGPAHADLLRLAAGGRGAVLEVACPRRSPIERSRSPAGAVLRVSCLGWLSPSLLVAMLAQGISNLWLDDSTCADCLTGSAHETIVRAVETANRLVGLFGRSPGVALYTGSPERLGTARTLEVWDPRRPVYSRRDLFTAFRRVATQTAATVADQALPAPAPAKLPRHLPAHRALLSAALPRLLVEGASAGSVSGLPVGKVEVSPGCTACGLCARICPTGALAFAKAQGEYSLKLSVTKCLGEACRLCSLICPVQAVGFAKQASPAELVNESPLTLRAGSVVACSRCGAPMAAPSTNQADGQAVCHICQWTKRFSADGPASQ
jgi:Fe-S-cluster-containing hydrogenase component 2